MKNQKQLEQMCIELKKLRLKENWRLALIEDLISRNLATWKEIAEANAIKRRQAIRDFEGKTGT